jgi:hypothetical protein
MSIILPKRFSSIRPSDAQVIKGQYAISFSWLDDNFDELAKLMNVSSTAPISSYNGQLWLDTSQSPPVLKIWNVNNWINAGYVTNSDKLDGFHANLTPSANVIVPLNTDGILDLSDTYVKSSMFKLNWKDLTNATEDYALSIGETAYISFSNTNTVSLHIATSNGTFYELNLLCSNNIGTSGATSGAIKLKPNNTTYTDAFRRRQLYVNSASTSVGYNVVNDDDTFAIGFAFSDSSVLISNFTTSKTVRCNIIKWGLTDDIATLILSASSWVDTTTAWTSLGTITFPQNTTGKILVRRLK